MAIPNTQELMLPILKHVADGAEYRRKEIVDGLAQQLNLTEEERTELTPGGSKAKFYSRVIGARSYLNYAGLLDSSRRGISVITEDGLSVLADNPETVDLEYLMRFPAFINHLRTSRSAQRDPALRRLLDKLLKETEEEPEPEVLQVPEVIPPPEPAIVPEVITQEKPQYIAELQMLDPMATMSFINQAMRPGLDDPEADQPTDDSKVNLFYLAALRLLENYFVHRWLYLLPIVLMIGAGIATALLVVKPEFVSTGVITVKRDSLIEVVSDVRDQGFGWRTPAQVTTEEVSELLQTNAFIRLIIESTELEVFMGDGPAMVNETITDVRSAVSVRSLGSNQLQIAATHEDREVAQQLADATVNAFIDWQIQSDQQDSSITIEFLENLAQEHQIEYDIAVEALEGYLLQNPEPVRGNRPELETLQVQRLQGNVSLASTRYNSTLSSLETVRLEEVLAEGKTRQTYTIVDSPQIPLEPEGSFADTAINVALFTATGIALTVIVILGNALIDRTMHYPIDVRYISGLPVLATVEAPPKQRGWFRRRKASADQPNSHVESPVSENDSTDAAPAPAA